MKKIILSIAILASGVSTYAMTNHVIPVNTINVVVNDGFTEVAVDKLPEAVTNAVKESYATASIDKAFINENGQYKLELTVDNASKTVYADSEGNLINLNTAE
ncbi:hypothetical protein AXE80_06480 [Wenyingzhuangia fucanilytica]|uniref:Beta-lactamase-inhibitor-like PepSY-like domain-containing protein n=1 Tax=Wenyingzhuangia fucanilytica TaxID=1790137 RepID=A0A1B1Y591_9FLAO|nr:hypothetical protein [Wenyingzhuangia fucanilytica]ANW95946.1 hypothetical protein AXE80_06480 [Wenyingzhuangia fucanilytica]